MKMKHFRGLKESDQFPKICKKEYSWPSLMTKFPGECNTEIRKDMCTGFKGEGSLNRCQYRIREFIIEHF